MKKIILFSVMIFLLGIYAILFISSDYFIGEKFGTEELDEKLTGILEQNGFDGRIPEQLELKLGRKLDNSKINLGKLVFFDAGLGLHQDNSCAGCHSPTAGFGDSQPIAIGINSNDTVGEHRSGPRNQRRTPTVINTAFYPNLMWNGRFASLTNDPFDNSKGFEFPYPEGDLLFNINSDYVERIRHLLVAQAHIPFTEQPEMAGFTTREGDGFASFARFSGLTITKLSPLFFISEAGNVIFTNNKSCGEIDFSVFNDGEGYNVPPMDSSINSANFLIRDKVLLLINANTTYRSLFGEIYPQVKNGSAINFKMVGEVLAEFEFSLTFAKAPLDEYARRNKFALTNAEKRGAVIFFTKGKCVTCHAVSGSSNQMFSDFKMHNAGVPQIHPVFGVGTGNVPFSELGCPKSATGTLDFGREEFTGDIADRYKFRSSPLRNLKAQTSYFHNGSFKLLKDALEFHLDPASNIKNYVPSQYGVPPDLIYDSSDMADVMMTLDPILKHGINLSENEKNDLLAFLQEGLYDKRVNDEELKKMIPAKVPSGKKLPYFEFGQSTTEKISADVWMSDLALAFQLYPNPVINNLYIEISEPGRFVKVEVIDATGAMYLEQHVNPAQQEIAISMQKLQPGLYFIRITDKDNAFVVKKVIKI